MFSFNLSSEDLNAVMLPVAVIAPVTVKAPVATAPEKFPASLNTLFHL